MMEHKYTEEFTLEGKDFIYIDLPGIKSNILASGINCKARHE